MEWSISQVLYVDDIKPYARNDQDTDSLIHDAGNYSKHIDMSFRVENCGQMVTIAELILQGVSDRRPEVWAINTYTLLNIRSSSEIIRE